MDDKSLIATTTEAPLVSVLMSVHNGEAYLRAAIDSIVTQDYPHWECIIIDDASNAATRDILDSFKTEERIRVIHQSEKRGLTKNLNTALSLSKGAFIARMDADDICLPERFGIQVAFLIQYPDVDVAASLVWLMNEKDEAIGTWGDDEQTLTTHAIKKVLPFRNCIAHPSVMMRRALLEAYRYDEVHTHSQDWDLWLRLIADGKKIEKITTPLLRYRVHGNSVTSSTNKKSSFAKKQETYSKYLRQVKAAGKMNAFNRVVQRAAFINRVKLALQKLKRSFNLSSKSS
jgi:glycosyltransferase involved in cell wall biosynthesis